MSKDAPVQLGQPIARVDGPPKVTGAARYAADWRLPDLCFGVIVHTTLASGVIESIDISAAGKLPGVLRVLAAANVADAGLPAQRRPFRAVGDAVNFIGQPVAVVVATSFEEARDAAAAVAVRYRAEKAIASVDDPAAEALPGGQSRGGAKRGDPEATLAGVSVKVEATYVTPIQTHHPMELGATIAAWSGDGRLTIYDGTQAVLGSRKQIADFFGLQAPEVTIVSPYVGGGFGARLRVWPHTFLAAVAARVVGRPVKITLTRTQMCGMFGHRPLSRQALTLGAAGDGRLSVIRQQTTTSTGAVDDFVEPVTNHTFALYAHEHSDTESKAVRLNVGAPAPMRAPGAPLGLFALETAMDELAVKLGIDPVELRILNETKVDPRGKKPWTDRRLIECLRRGAERFGWADRPKAPGGRRQGNWLIGAGVASAAWHGGNSPATARVRVLRDGTAMVASATHDMGTGTYTIMAQAVAEVLGLPVSKVSAELGMSTLPPAPTAGGSRSASSVVPAVVLAAEAARKKLIELAVSHEHSPLRGLSTDAVVLLDGQAQAKDDAARAIGLGELVGLTGQPNLEVTESFNPEGSRRDFAAMTFGAHFFEVKVHALTGECRVTRAVGVFDVGRVFNRRTAEAQLSGGMVWGIGMALTEAAHLDSSARYAGADLGGYHLPSHADVPTELVAEALDVPDPNFGALGSRGGVGELSISGVAAAIGNAIFNATGKRLREVPFTPDKLL